MIKTTIIRTWICEVCGYKEDVVGENIKFEKLSESQIAKIAPTKDWFTQWIAIPHAGSVPVLLCPKCAATLKGDTFGERALSYSKLFYGERPILTVDIIVIKGNKFLLIKRKNPPFGWAIAGGLVDHGETVEHAAVRELKEETSLKTTENDLNFLEIRSNPTRDPRFHAVSIIYVALQWTGVPKAADDAKDLGWFTIDEIKDLDIAFDHKEILRKHYDLGE